MEFKMTQFVSDREPLPIRVMQGINADNWEPVFDIYHPRQLGIERRVSKACAYRPCDLVNWRGDGADLETGKKLSRSSIRVTA
jgi:hypothetical protein